MAKEEKIDAGPKGRKAVALKYTKGEDEVPLVVGKGRGLLAEKIIAIAEEKGISIVEDADLVEILSRLDINQEIPEETYFLVAEILAFVYRTNKRYSEQLR